MQYHGFYHTVLLQTLISLDNEKEPGSLLRFMLLMAKNHEMEYILDAKSPQEIPVVLQEPFGGECSAQNSAK